MENFLATKPVGIVPEPFTALETDRVLATKLRMSHFRNYESLDLPLLPGFTILAGENAQGKTNILEAIYLLCTGRLLRGRRESEAILDGTEKSELELTLSPHGTTLGIHLERGQKKRAFLNSMSLPRPSDLLGRLPCVVISTEDLLLTRGEPSDRRFFLDIELSSLYPAYLRHFSVYKRALDQRNSLLKQSAYGNVDNTALGIWEGQLAEHGAAIREARYRYVQELLTHAHRFHQLLSKEEELNLTYISKTVVTHREELTKEYELNRENDIRRGTTTIGPHRDDVEVLINERDSRLFGSQGQQRSAAISMKLAAFEVARHRLGFAPLLLLDDMFSDLDKYRREALSTVAILASGQAILTCTEASLAGDSILGKATLYNVKAGTVNQI